VPIRGFTKGTGKFPIQKCAIFRKFKEIKELRRGILLYAAQAIPPIDAEIPDFVGPLVGCGIPWNTEETLNIAAFNNRRPSRIYGLLISIKRTLIKEQ